MQPTFASAGIVPLSLQREVEAQAQSSNPPENVSDVDSTTDIATESLLATVSLPGATVPGGLSAFSRQQMQVSDSLVGIGSEVQALALTDFTNDSHSEARSSMTFDFLLSHEGAWQFYSAGLDVDPLPESTVRLLQGSTVLASFSPSPEVIEYDQTLFLTAGAYRLELESFISADSHVGPGVGGNRQIQMSFTSVPEPSTLAFAFAALGAALCWARPLPFRLRS